MNIFQHDLFPFFPVVFCVEMAKQLNLSRQLMALWSGVTRVFIELHLNPLIFFETLVFIEQAIWNRVDANPAAVPQKPGSANRFSIFCR